MAKVKIVSSGPLSTIQDRGRYGYMQFGLMPAGAMDEWSMRLANLLVGNDPNEAVIESAYLGPTLEFDCDETVAVTGAKTKVTLNGIDVPMWQSLKVKPGDVLKLAPVTAGLYNYIAFGRTIDVPVIMGSKSTYLRGKLGGLDGRKLQKDDLIPLGETPSTALARQVPAEKQPEFQQERTLRVVLGPQDHAFTEEGLDKFLSEEYTITQEADRMGYRLDGAVISHKVGPDVISDGIAHGTVQVPGNGLPIILLSDRGTTGGYTKIATVLASDICALVQMTPGSRVRFQAVTAEEANQIYREAFGDLDSLLSDIPEVVEEAVTSVDDGFTSYQVMHEGREYIIRVKKLT